MVQQKSQDSFIPLIEQLTSRAVYIMRRLTDIAERILESRKRRPEDISNVSVEDTDQYPYFTYHVKDLYFKFVDNVAKTCKEKCMDEFYSTRTIYWDLTEYSEKTLPLDRSGQEDTKKVVLELAKQLFETLKTRITKNVMLKFYNFFLVPM